MIIEGNLRNQFMLIVNICFDSPKDELFSPLAYGVRVYRDVSHNGY